jgi:hypothetical protein
MGIRDDGSPDRRHRIGRTEADVTRKVQELEGKRDAGKAGRAGKPLTVADWMQTWLTTVAPRTVSQGTLDSGYEPKARRWIIPKLGKHRLDRLQPEHLDALYVARYTWLAEQGLKPNTILQIHRILSRALKVAWKRGKTGHNVAMLVDAPVGEESDIEALSREEAIGLRWKYVKPGRGHHRGRLAAQAGSLPAWLRGPCHLYPRTVTGRPARRTAQARARKTRTWLSARPPALRSTLMTTGDDWHDLERIKVLAMTANIEVKAHLAVRSSHLAVSWPFVG